MGLIQNILSRVSRYMDMDRKYCAATERLTDFRCALIQQTKTLLKQINEMPLDKAANIIDIADVTEKLNGICSTYEEKMKLLRNSFKAELNEKDFDVSDKIEKPGVTFIETKRHFQETLYHTDHVLAELRANGLDLIADAVTPEYEAFKAILSKEFGIGAARQR